MVALLASDIGIRCIEAPSQLVVASLAQRQRFPAGTFRVPEDAWNRLQLSTRTPYSASTASLMVGRATPDNFPKKRGSGRPIREFVVNLSLVWTSSADSRSIGSLTVLEHRLAETGLLEISSRTSSAQRTMGRPQQPDADDVCSVDCVEVVLEDLFERLWERAGICVLKEMTETVVRALWKEVRGRGNRAVVAFGIKV